MDIYSFVNSKDIREHLRKMDYRFNSLETAWLIYQCRHMSYEEQKVAWTELIHTMPDCEVPKRSNCRGWNSLHAMLQEYMDTYDKIIAEFYNDDPEEKYVYMYSYLYKGDRRWTEEFDTLYGSLEECLKAYKEDVDDLDETYSPDETGVLLLHTGMRCGEMIALRWKDVDFENGLLKIEKSQSMAKNREWEEGENKYIPIEGTTKNEKAREIRLTKEALDALRLIRVMNSNIAENDFVCVTKTGKTNTATNLGHRMAVIFKNAGLSEYTGSLHIFRRTFATKMYEDGARVEDIAAYIGDLVSTTEKYYIAIRKKVKLGEKTKHIVEVPKKQIMDNKAV